MNAREGIKTKEFHCCSNCNWDTLKTMNAREGIKTGLARCQQRRAAMLKTMNAREGIKTSPAGRIPAPEAAVKNNECP